MHKKKPNSKILTVEVVAGRNLVAMDDDGLSDPYVIVSVGKEKYKTKIIRSTLYPNWQIGSSMEKFVFTKGVVSDKQIVFKCMDWDRFKSDDRMGKVSVPISSLSETKDIDEWFSLKPQKPGDIVSGELHLRIKLRDIEDQDLQHTTLWHAVKNDNLSQVVQDIKHIDLSEVDPENQDTILHLATKTVSNPAIVNLLIEAGCSTTVRNSTGDTPLHTFCRYFAYPSEVLEKLLNSGVNVNVQNEFGETPLHHVVFNPSIRLLMAEALLNKGADPNIIAKNKDAPIHYAVETGRADIVGLLICYGADLTKSGSKGSIPLTLAKNLNFTSVYRAIRDCTDLKQHLDRIKLGKYCHIFVKEELYLYLLPDLADRNLEKLISNEEDRKILKESLKDVKSVLLNSQASFVAKQIYQTKGRTD